MTDLSKLIGLTIRKIELGDGNTHLILTTDDGEIGFNAYGDCCSSSWFSNITGIKNLLNQKILDVVERQEFSKEEQNRAEVQYRRDNKYQPEDLKLYGFIVKTNKGSCDIEFRNESNGYYGGSIESSGIERDGEYKNIVEDF